MAELESLMESIDLKQSGCTHCGLCLDSCITYLQSGWEMESPRGRLRLSKEFIEGRLDPASPLLETFDRCLACGRCERACPVRVPYSEIISEVQELRSRIRPKPVPSKNVGKERLRSPLWRHWYSRSLGKEIQGEPSPGSYLYKHGTSRPSEGVLFIPCRADLCDHTLIRQALEVSRELGHELDIFQKQGCCDEEQGIEGEWFYLSEDCRPQGSIRSLADLLAGSLEKRGLALPKPQTLYYHPSCYGGDDPYLKLLQGLQGLRLLPAPFAHACCGARGSAEQMASLIRWRSQLLLPEVSLLISSARCLIAYRRYSLTKVCHPIQMLHQALFQ